MAFSLVFLVREAMNLAFSTSSLALRDFVSSIVYKIISWKKINVTTFFRSAADSNIAWKSS